MKKIFCFPFWVFAATFIVLANQFSFAYEGGKNEPELQTFTGTIAGKVVDKETQQPLPNVTVQLVGSSLGTATDLDGKFTIKNVAENIYKVKFSSVGYGIHIETEIRVIRNKTTTIKDIELNEHAVANDVVEITAGAFSEDKVSTLTNYSYSREEIRRSPGATGDIFRAIETLPGVSSSGGEFSSFAVRGGSPRDNIVLVDNIPFDKVSHFDGGTEEQEAQGGRFSIFTPGLIDEANFQAGGFSAKYGGKNASFVDLKIKEGNKESFTMNGSYDILGWEVNYDGPSYIGKNTSVMFSARHQDFKTVLGIMDQKDLGHPYFTDIIAKTTTELDSKNKISILGIYSPDFFERTIENVYEIKDNNYDNNLAKGTDTKYLLGINWRTLTSESSFLENTLYYRGDDADFSRSNSYVYPVNGAVPAKKDAYVRNNYYTWTDNEKELGVKSQFTTNPTAALTLTSGFQVNRTSFSFKSKQIDAETLYTFDKNDFRPDPSKYFIVIDPSYINSSVSSAKIAGAVFTDLNYSLTEKLMIVPGVRYEYSEFNKNSYVSPRISARYQLTENTKLSAATGVYYQPIELRTISEDYRNAFLGNERAVHYIVGLTSYLSDDIKLTTEVYYKDLSNLIVKTDRTSQLRKNGGSGNARGIDLSLVKKFVDKWYGQINYSFSVSRRNDNDGLGEYNSDFDQPNIVNILFGYEFNDEWSFSTKWKYASGRPKDSYIVHANILNDPSAPRYSKEITGNNTERLQAFHTLNLRIDYRKQFDHFAIVAFLDILDLYNRLNVNEERFIETTGKVSEKGFKMIPSFGFKLEY